MQRDPATLPCALCATRDAEHYLFSDVSLCAEQGGVLFPACDRCNLLLAGMIDVMGADAGRWRSVGLEQVTAGAAAQILHARLTLAPGGGDPAIRSAN